MEHLLVYICSCMSVVYSCSDQVISSCNVNCSAVCRPEICSVPCLNKTKVIHIQGFIPFDNHVFVAESLIPAVWVATEDINGDCSILPEYSLQIDIVNTKCNPAVSSYLAMSSAEHNDRKVLVYLGGGCSLATEPLVTIAGSVFNIPTVSYGASSPALSNAEQFPNFFRTIPSEIQSNSARFALMSKYNWTKIATLYETVSLFSLAVEDFGRQYKNIYGKENSHLVLSFSDSPANALQHIHDKDFRIIMGYFYEDKAIATLCHAYHLKLTTPEHVWILPAWYDHDWYDTEYHSSAIDNHMECTKEQLREAVKYALFLDSYNESNTTTDTGSTSTTREFVNKLDCYLEEFRQNPSTGKIFKQKSEAHIYSGFTYDAVWMIAFALDRTERELAVSGSGLSLQDFQYFEANNVSRIIAHHLSKTNFSGVSGPVLLDENGTRSGLTGIYQLRENPNNESELIQMLIGIHHPGLRGPNGRFNYNFNYLSGLEPKWKGGRIAPSDHNSPLRIHLNTVLVYTAHTFASFTFIAALAALFFNVCTLSKPEIKYSAPHINTVIIIGCGVMAVGSILLGVDSTIDNNVHPDVLCTLRVWILTLGFTLSFGALFAKTCQVYIIYTNKELKDKPFKMRRFFIIMAIFLTIDAAFLGFWTGKYPFQRMLITIVKSDGDQTKVLEYEYCYCDEFGYLIASLFTYKGILVICGLFLAYESRNVKYFYINDSRFVSITMYIVVILIGIGAPLSLVLAVHYFIDAAFGLTTFTISAACTASILILYVPKIYKIASPSVVEEYLENPDTSMSLSQPETGKKTINNLDVNDVCECEIEDNNELDATDSKQQVSVASKSNLEHKRAGVVTETC